MTLEEVDDVIFQRAAQIIADRREHVPMLVVVSPDDRVGVIEVTALMTDDLGKEMLGGAIQLMAKARDVALIAFIAEAWMRHVPYDAPPDERALGHPDSVEVLMVTYYAKSGERAMASHRIRRLDDMRPQLIRGELVRGDALNELQGRFMPQGRPQ